MLLTLAQTSCATCRQFGGCLVVILCYIYMKHVVYTLCSTPSPNATLEPVYNTVAAFNAIDTYQIFSYGLFILSNRKASCIVMITGITKHFI